jgi:hypothetical protein
VGASRRKCGFDQFRTLVAHALSDWFSPSLDFQQALFIVGSALCTVGLSGIEAPGPARWALVFCGFSGLSVLTMAVTYLLEVQEGKSRRGSGIFEAHDGRRRAAVCARTSTNGRATWFKSEPWR